MGQVKKRDVEIGAVYVAKVNNKLVRVRIDEGPTAYYSGWHATNLDTGRKIWIKTAARLRRVVSQPAMANNPWPSCYPEGGSK